MTRPGGILGRFDAEGAACGDTWPRRTCKGGVNTKIWHRKESGLWAQIGEKIHPEEGRFLQEDSAKKLAVGSWLPFGKGSVCADFVGLHHDVARAESTNGWISDHT
jgi:hypothetical protein